jgi:zinc protease
MRKQRTSLLAALFVLASPALFAQAKLVEKVAPKGTDISIPYEKYVLPNGLTLVVHEDHSDPVVHVDVTYHVGSAREEIGKSGFAHFFEHMMFQGSDNVQKGDHFKVITEAGGTLNGSTNRDRTNYYQTIPSNQLEKILWLEADRMGFLLDAVTQEKFENQRSTVKNERGQNYDNRPYGLTQEFAAKNLYPYGHPYSWLTIGYVEDLNRVNVNDLKNFFLRWYGPNNAVLTIGGDVNTAAVVTLVEKYFGSIPKGPRVDKTVLPAVKIDKDRYVSFVDNYARVPLFVKVFATVPMYHPDMAALDCLAQILGQGKTSIFYQEMVKPQRVLQANANSSLSELAGEFSIQVVPFPGKSLVYADSLVREAMAAFEKRGVTDEDIAKFKGGIESQYANRLQSVSGKVTQLASFQTFTGNPDMIGKLLKQYLAVTRADVLRVYNTYLRGKASVNVSVLTKGQEKMVAAADNYQINSGNYKAPSYGYEGLVYTKPKDKFDRSKIPGNGPNPTVNVPPYWKKDLGNGMEAIGTRNAEVPTVTLFVRVPGGHLAQSGTPDKTGLASMTAAMLNEDTKNYSAEQMTLELQKLGSNINVGSELDGISFTVQCLKKNLDKTLALLEERMFQPNFTEEAFSRLQKQRLESFKQMKSQPAAVASMVWDKINFGPNHILGMSDAGTETTVKNLTLADVQQYYNTWMSSQGTKVVVVGDITEAEITPKLAFLKKLPNRTLDLPSPGPAPKMEKAKIYLVDVPKAAQTEFRVGYVTGLKYDATGEFYKVGLMNYPLGGSFNSIINFNLRETRGWTYGARTGFSADQYTGEFLFSSGIRADATDSALTDLLRDLRAYAANGVKPEDLAFTKAAIGQRDALLYETGIQKAGFIGRILEYNLPADFVQSQNKILRDMSKADMDALAKKYIDVDRMNILLVGDKSKILPTLDKFGYEIVELDADGNPRK